MRVPTSSLTVEVVEGKAKCCQLVHRHVYGNQADNSDVVPKSVKKKKAESSSVQDDIKHCVHKDICEMYKPKSYCYTHRQECPHGQGAALSSCGFCCRNLSKLFKHESGECVVDYIGRAMGSTGETFEGWLGHLLRDSPAVIQAENVIELKLARNKDPVMIALGKAGYWAELFEVNSADFGVSCRQMPIPISLLFHISDISFL